MNTEQIEALAWQKQGGLLPAIVQDAGNLRVLMLGYMDAEALRRTLDTGQVTFFSRSKNRLWTKGEQSGHFLQLVSVQADCDHDSLLVLARPQGPTCHLQRDSCFADAPGNALVELQAVIESRRDADPARSYSKRLLDAGLPAVAQKVGEEAVETVIAALAQSDRAVLDESADLLYHLLLLLQLRQLNVQEVLQVLQQRHTACKTTPPNT